ncbi:glutamate formimidoyltransferase [Hugenholtzia roseola]|uniref:glutamate formimidoyltransferase n=1 Tax=Hugenholtzia roseola TaxID=1002 RepID=UPI00047D9A54|nr:glutamate formimidoyltransferase [Hugenholtzia roseola]
MKQLIECVPNFSEGRDLKIIKEITDQIESVEGVQLLDVDPGYATNRTVVTFVGEPAPVLEAAFRAIKKAQELIDMRKHKGEHPRFGATDVCPLVPIANISMEETAKLAHQLAERVGRELDYAVYCYESAATKPERKNLAYVRAGEYEALPEKLKKPEHKPDYGAAEFRPRTGATAIGARDFLIAVNFNLNTTSTRRANAVAFDVREAGRVVMDSEGKPLVDEKGEPIRQAGACKGTKAIGWYIAEYGIAQVSMNITDINATPLHLAFEAIAESAYQRGLRVTGTEIVGLLPLRMMLEAGKYFLRKQQRSVGVSEAELIKIAIKSMGLDDLKPFIAEEKIIEYRIAEKNARPLVGLSLADFAHETASESPAPGGGSVSAYMGALGAALGTMVANLSSHKRGWDAHWEEFSNYAEEGEKIKNRLLYLVDEDTAAFNAIMEAFKLPKDSEQEKIVRSQAIAKANRNAIEVPLEIIRTAVSAFPLIKAMAASGNPNSVSDAGVGALALRAAVRGAYLNVQINAASESDKEYVAEIFAEAKALADTAEKMEAEVLEIVQSKM